MTVHTDTFNDPQLQASRAPQRRCAVTSRDRGGFWASTLDLHRVPASKLSEKGKRRRTLVLRSCKRIKQIGKIIADMEDRGEIFDRSTVTNLVFVLACALYFTRPYQGEDNALDGDKFDDVAHRIGLSKYLRKCRYRQAIERARKSMWRGPLGDERAGGALKLTAERRRRLGIDTIGSIDEDPDQRRERQKNEHRCKQALRYHHKVMAKKGHPPTPRRMLNATSRTRTKPWLKEINPRTGKPYSRSAWYARRKEPRPFSVASIKPWQIEGVSRATWYRRRAVSPETDNRLTAYLPLYQEARCLRGGRQTTVQVQSHGVGARTVPRHRRPSSPGKPFLGPSKLSGVSDGVLAVADHVGVQAVFIGSPRAGPWFLERGDHSGVGVVP